MHAAADDASTGKPHPPAPPEPPKLKFKTLARGANEVVIELDGQLYRLRLTKNGRLVLNK